MNTDMTEDVARAVHQVLAKNLMVQQFLGEPPRLYDYAPEDPIYPYLSYGRLRSEDKSGDAVSLHSHQLTLHIWSRYHGRGEIVRLMDVLKTALSEGDLIAAELTENNLVSAAIIFSDILRATDGRTHHGLLRLSLLTDHPSS
jgi:hypothetical protein